MTIHLSKKFQQNSENAGGSYTDTAVLAAVAPLRDAGFALHWLKPRDKRPVGEKWSEQPVSSLERLLATHRPGYNVGVRLGEPSEVGGGYLHVLDMDIRVDELKDEAWAALHALFPDLNIADLPCVQSGSGGESRHLYLILDKPFRSKMLAVSPGKHKRVKDGKEGWSYDWEIELFGTGKQVVLPPSIHPDTGKPYLWLREFDFALLDFDMGPFVPSAAIERLAVAEHAIYEFETREPLTFAAGQLERALSDINVSELHYDDWIRLGQALHHQFGGSQEGFDLWLEHTKRSTKFTGEKQVREMRRTKWKSFGRYRGKPVTMATIVEWAKDARLAAFRDDFDEEEDDPQAPPPPATSLARSPEPVDEIDALGGDEPVPAAAGAFDDILGGDEPAEGEEEEVDEIDALGGAIPVKGQSRTVSGDWISLLDINDKGAIISSLHNVELIVANDPRLVGLPQLNEFTQETVQRTPPGFKANRRRNAAKATRQLEGRVWQIKDTLNGELWSDDRDFAIRSILEAPGTQGGYGIKVTDRDLKAAVVLAANANAFHPVREYLSALRWDGTQRAESLFRDYLGAPDDAYSREVSRLMLVSAVTRIFEPGHKVDHVVILEGLQGKRKSTFIRILGRHWFGELNGNWDDAKQMIEQMQGKWIMEVPELSGFGRSDVRSIKAFVTTQSDRARLAYARRAGEFPRQCIFLGSTNDREYLKDDTGGRRWWPMLCRVAEIDTAGLEANIDQIWAEAVVLYQGMRRAMPTGTLPLYLADADAQSTAAMLQESRRVESAEDGLAGQIEEWLSRPVVTGSLEDDVDDRGEPVYRTETCLIEVWEGLGNDAKSYNEIASRRLGRAMRFVPEWDLCNGRKRFGRHGVQRFYSKGGHAGYLERQGVLDRSAA